MLGGHHPFSAHSDLLSATASSLDDAFKLVEECKSRGRNTVVSKRYPEALELYSKAITVLSTFVVATTSDKQEEEEVVEESSQPKRALTSELAVLYSNRSLVRLQMNQVPAAMEDATTATCYDETYVKGHWRLGQAAMALKEYDTALNAYRKALQLEPENKALFLEIQKAEQQQQQQQQKNQVNSSNSTQSNTINMEETQDLYSKKEANASQLIPNKSEDTKTGIDDTKKVSSKATTTENSYSSHHKQGDDDLFSSSDHVRGYKLVNGKKTSFFHHEQSEKEKLLIGDIAPKRIDHSTTTATANPKTMDIPTKNTSAWNKAGTWEERDLTHMAISTLSDTLLHCTYTLPTGVAFAGSTVRVTKLSPLQSIKEGGTTHASIATVRGKKRFIFEFTVTVYWELILIEQGGNATDGNTANICKGSLTFLDVDGTHELGQGYDVSDYTVDKDSPSHAKFILERFVRDGGLRTVLEQAMDHWIVSLRDNN